VQSAPSCQSAPEARHDDSRRAPQSAAGCGEPGTNLGHEILGGRFERAGHEAQAGHDQRGAEPAPVSAVNADPIQQQVASDAEQGEPENEDGQAPLGAADVQS
jgi:hypothetical protein